MTQNQTEIIDFYINHMKVLEKLTYHDLQQLYF